MQNYINNLERVDIMTKLLGIVLIISSIVALIGGTLMGRAYGSDSQITGNLIANIIEQPSVNMGFFDYVQAVSLSYSIMSLIMGLVFLIRV